MACTDLRGHGDSDTTFASYGDVETAGDILAQTIEELGVQPLIIPGNSMAAGAATLVASATGPTWVAGLVLIGPFVRNGKAKAIERDTLRLAMARPRALPRPGSPTCPKLYAGRRPGDFEGVPGDGGGESPSPGLRQGLLTHNTDRPGSPWRLCLGDEPAPVHGHHGRARPGLYRSRHGGRLDRAGS